MKKEQPCYLCITTSVVLSIAMVVATVKIVAWMFGQGKQKLRLGSG